MSDLAEIEAAIEKLPSAQVDQLARWLQTLRQLRTAALPLESWLSRSRGAARLGVSTDDVLALTRGEE